jgi:hypothetical protein
MNRKAIVAMDLSRFLMLILVTASVGCGGGRGNSESRTQPEVTPREAIKKSLTRMLESGAPGSEIGGVLEGIEALQKSEPAVAASLKEEADELVRLMSLEDHAGMQAKIDEMLVELEGTGGE